MGSALHLHVHHIGAAVGWNRSPSLVGLASRPGGGVYTSSLHGNLLPADTGTHSASVSWNGNLQSAAWPNVGPREGSSSESSGAGDGDGMLNPAEFVEALVRLSVRRYSSAQVEKKRTAEETEAEEVSRRAAVRERQAARARRPRVAPARAQRRVSRVVARRRGRATR